MSDYVEQYLTEHAAELKERSEALAQQCEKDVSGVRAKITKKLVSKARIARTGPVTPKSPRPSISAESPRSVVKSPVNKKKLEQVFGYVLTLNPNTYYHITNILLLSLL